MSTVIGYATVVVAYMPDGRYAVGVSVHSAMEALLDREDVDPDAEADLAQVVTTQVPIPVIAPMVESVAVDAGHEEAQPDQPGPHLRLVRPQE